MAETTKQGIHGGRRRNRGEAWPNTKAPEHHPGRKIRAARKKLDARVKEWEALHASKKEAYHKPGSMKCR